MTYSGFLFIASTFIITCTSCNFDNTRTRVNNSLVLNNETKVDNGGLYFLRTSAFSGLMEVQLGKLAIQKTMNKRIKAFGQMMISDHSKIYKEVYELGISKKLLMPEVLPPDLQQNIENLKQKNSNEFDYNYMKMMIENHQDAIQTFEIGIGNRKKDIKEYAKERLPIIKTHLDSANSIYNSLNNPIQQIRTGYKP